MAAESRTQLKTYFNTGDTPTEAQFVNLIDSFHNDTDDGSAATASSTTTFTNKTFDANATGNSLTNVETADIASGSKTGLDATLVTGSEGLSGEIAHWNVDGDLISAGIQSSVLVQSDVSTELTVGYSGAVYSLGTPAASSTVTLDEANGNYQKLTNDDNFTLEPPALTGAGTNFVIHVTNSADTPGTITFGSTNGGFQTPDGDSVSTTVNTQFFLHITCSDNGGTQHNTVFVKELV